MSLATLARRHAAEVYAATFLKMVRDKRGYSHQECREEAYAQSCKAQCLYLLGRVDSVSTSN